MFNITVRPDSSGTRTLALSGSIEAESVQKIDRLIKDVRQTPGPVVLDMGEVTLMDRVAARFLARQQKRGVALVNCPRYIEHWITQQTAPHE